MRRGFTLLEVLIASSIMMVAVGITYAVWQTVTTSFNILQSHVTARQEVRKVSNTIIGDIRNACYLYADRNVTIQGVNYDVGAIDVAKHDLLLAAPENPNVGNVTYTVVGYHLEQDNTDPANPTAHNLVRTEWNNITPVTPDTPAVINLSALTGGQKKIVARYIDSARFSFTIRKSGNSIDIRPLATKREYSNQHPVDVQVFMSVNIKNK